MVNSLWLVRDFICVKIINIYITLSCILYNILYDNADVCSKHIAEKPGHHVNYQCNHFYSSCFHRCHRRQNCGVNKIKSRKCFVGEKDVLFIAVLVGWCVREQNTAIVLLRFSVPSYFAVCIEYQLLHHHWNNYWITRLCVLSNIFIFEHERPTAGLVS